MLKTTSKISLGVGLVLTLLSSITNATMNCTTSGAIQQYNGHYYTTTSSTYSFTDASALAQSDGGYLAIPNDVNENNFIKGLVGGGRSGWIGIYDQSMMTDYSYYIGQTIDTARFTDVKGGALSYSNWSGTQPDNMVDQNDTMNGQPIVAPLGEHWVAMDGDNGLWFDTGNHADSNSNPAKFRAVFEFDTAPACYQGSDANSTLNLTSPAYSVQTGQ